MAEIERLPEEHLRALLEALRRANGAQPVRRWSAAIGSISDEDAQAMLQAIEEDCETIGPEAW